MGPVLYRDKLRSVLTGKSGDPGVNGSGGTMQPVMCEGGAMLVSSAAVTGVDDGHLLPLVYQPHHSHQKMEDTVLSPRRQMSASSATTSTTAVPSSSEASSTASDDDDVVEPDEGGEILFQHDDEEKTPSKRWSRGWAKE